MVFNWLAATFKISEKWVKKAYKLGMFEIPKVTEEDLEKSRKKEAAWRRSMRAAEKSLRADLDNRQAEHNRGLNSEAANRIVWQFEKFSTEIFDPVPWDERAMPSEYNEKKKCR